jgi:hypothetical protein
MNRFFLIKVGAPALAVALLVASARIFGGGDAAAPAAAPAKKGTVSASGGDKVPASSAVSGERLRDPFSDSASEEALASDGVSPTGMSVIGVIIMESGAKLAMLRVPGYEHAVLVREGDVLSLGSGDGLGVDAVVRVIGESEVGISPKDDPDNLTTIR